MSGTANPAQSSGPARDAATDIQRWQTLLESIPYARHLGLEIVPDSTGVQVHLPFREALVGNVMLPALHGGVLGALIEITARIAAQGEDAMECRPRILDCNVDYLRSARTQSTFASAEIVRRGRRVVLVRVTCWQDRITAPVASARVQLLLDTVSAANPKEAR
ncbi:menaquinone-specific isochorismate synthase protein [Salinisphaera shabanensis E1L3A]|jgi:uncharacterized protein (TIGR00369 family)|uniref:Menaquinone-specific isochorismate synthase protein n=1 Tax=Salinisphaera shabanensis E1L3A TaxID=1033802 RepID=F7Q4C8_9GAMM|nr:hotdog fold thioesterase [Salinisphaera shabanensis]ERJ17446.1 menaquinone-specific isochorismate synthase protein [Salinisphaera shabanensis E1L3A]